MHGSRPPLLPLIAASLIVAAGCAPGGGGGRGAGDAGSTASAAFDPDSVPEGYARPTAALVWPLATRAIEVTPAGDLYNGDWQVAIRPSADGIAATGPKAVAYEARWRPIAHWRRHSAGVRWDFEACALPTGAPVDSGLFASVEIRATNLGSAPSAAAIEIALEPRPSGAPFVFFDAPESTAILRWAGSDRAPAYGWASGGGSGSRVQRSWRLEPGAQATLRIVVPAYPAPGSRLSAWARTPHARRADEARRAWEALLGRSTRFELGDPEVEAALRASLVVLLACRERRGAGTVPIGSPFQYRDVWLRDGARAVAALAVTGYGAEARDLASSLTLLQWPSGAFLSQAGQLDGTGQALWAFGQAYLRPAAGPLEPRLAAAIARGWRWCEAQRAMGRREGSGTPGMLPFGDPHDNEYVRAELTGNDAWSIAGYRWGALLLRSGSGAALADSMDRARAAYQTDFDAALAHSGSRDIPPAWTAQGQRSALDWGNLAVAWPCQALPVRDPRCFALARRMWARTGGAGLVSYRAPDSLSYYLGADLATWALLAGERAAADSVLDAMLRFRTAGGGAGELFNRLTRDFGDNLPPHATAAAALVTLIRNTLVFDDGDTLELTLGARERWWRGARVSGAPTRWGTLELEFHRAGDAAEWGWTPVPVWTALHLPPGTRLAAPPAAPLEGAKGGTIVRVPPGVGRARAELASGG